MMERLAVPFRRLQPGRYAAGLRAALHTHEPRRRLDLLLCGAIIEARSCERFRLLGERLPDPLGSFYGELARAEARHADLYLNLADAAADESGLDGCGLRLQALAGIEAGLIASDDTQLRFHSGPPTAPAPAPALAAVRGSVSSS
jgi:tRNA-(ms[2]io[6]A)-hydroxylase